MTLTHSTWLDDVRLAHLLADAADRITMARFGAADLLIERKADSTEVTEADLAAEREMRALLSRARPDDAILGEEYGHDGDGERVWVLDPIDGTANFARGVPIWATLIALTSSSRPVVGLVSAPALGRRWWAAEGAGAYRGTSATDGVPLRVSTISDVSDAFVSYSSLHGWAAVGLADQFHGLLTEAGRTRGFGDFLSYMFVAEGSVDIATEPELARHDVAALVPIVREAGGTMTSITGGDPLADGSALAANPALHALALQRLAAG